MFHDIPERILGRMRALEHMDARDRADGTPRLKRLRQIPPEVGRFIALMAASSPAVGPGANPTPRWLEIGTSAGYSTLWLALAARALGRRITTFEVLADKAALAAETIALAGVGDVVELVHGDALDHLPTFDGIAFCFLDAEKEVYGPCYELLIPRMVSGGLLVADNAINHEAVLRPMLDRSLSDGRVDAMIVPFGNGELLCRKK